MCRRSEAQVQGRCSGGGYEDRGEVRERPPVAVRRRGAGVGRCPVAEAHTWPPRPSDSRDRHHRAHRHRRRRGESESVRFRRASLAVPTPNRRYRRRGQIVSLAHGPSGAVANPCAGPAACLPPLLRRWRSGFRAPDDPNAGSGRSPMPRGRATRCLFERFDYQFRCQLVARLKEGEVVQIGGGRGGAPT